MQSLPLGNVFLVSIAAYLLNNSIGFMRYDHSVVSLCDSLRKMQLQKQRHYQDTLMSSRKNLLAIYRTCAVLSLPPFNALLSFKSPSFRPSFVPRQMQEVADVVLLPTVSLF